MIKVYSEEQWFDTFYPTEWGNWREFYNISKYRESQKITGCSWMNYKLTGYCLSENSEGLMKVNTYNYGKPYYYDHFFVETSCDEIQPFYQPRVNKYYAGVGISKLTSNLNIHSIYIYGCDDASYTKHFDNELELQTEISKIKMFGISHIFTEKSGYFFTN